MLQKIIALCFVATSCLAYSAKEMNLEEKVGQILMVHFHGEQVNEDAQALIQEMHVGGFIYYNWANGLSSPSQVKSLGLGLQKLAQETRLSIPLFITVDQEGGIVARLTQGFTIFPGNKALGMTGHSELAQQSALAMGQELQVVAVNMNLSPVVDINSNPRNPVIGIRSFSDFPETVIAFGREALNGYTQSGIMKVLKHFPGHGDVGIDSHYDLPIINKSQEELTRVELRPFAELASQADAIMTAHILVPALDPENCSTLSKKTLDFLRTEIGFKGVIISDSLVMEGVLKKCGSVDEATIQALNAGCDLLILGGKQLIDGTTKLELTVSDIHRIHHSLVEAVKSGRISEERLNQAVDKVVQLKNRYLLKPAFLQEINQVVKTVEHQDLAKKIAALSLRIIKNESSCLASLSKKKVVVFAPQAIKDPVQQTTLLKTGKETSSFFFEGLNPSESDMQAIKENAKTADVVIFCSYNSWRNAAQAMLIRSLLELGKPMILFVVRDPQDATLYPKANVIITTFSPTAPSIQAGCDQLK
jgi:beta-N-acetylhexosaminidase